MTVCCMHPCWCVSSSGTKNHYCFLFEQDNAGLNTNSEISLLGSSEMAVIVSCASAPPPPLQNSIYFW
ncbi:hypothetical protein IMY05_006G0120100 [Salix suchowensis]|nr:hypothetical protein IMY05_006G0120100 [Salix suchowensis]